MINWGDVPLNSVIPFPFDTFAGATGASVTLTGLAVADILVYKGVSMTQRSSTAGFVLMDTDGIDLDTRTGIHGFSIDTSDNTDAGFFVAGSFYWVIVDAVTIDGQTVRFVAGTFFLRAAEGVAGVSDVNITHVADAAVSTTSAQLGVNVVQAGTVAWASGALTAAVFAADAITAAKIAADVATEINAGVLAVLGALADASADGDPTSTDTLMAYLKQVVNVLVGTAGVVTFPASAAPGNAISLAEVLRAIYDDTNALPDAGALTTIQGDLDDIQTRLPSALVGARMDASVGAMAANVLNAAAADPDLTTELQAGLATAASVTALPTAAQNADAVWDELRSGHVTAGSFGQALQVLRSATAQAGGAATITLDASASANDNEYIDLLVLLVGGTGEGQFRRIASYVGATKVATVTGNWSVQPASGSIFVILGV